MTEVAGKAGTRTLSDNLVTDGETMVKRLGNFLKTTVLGGFFALLPVGAGD
jgi:hypothetical protein